MMTFEVNFVNRSICNRVNNRYPRYYCDRKYNHRGKHNWKDSLPELMDFANALQQYVHGR